MSRTDVQPSASLPGAGPRLDLLENPFTRPGSRLLVFRTDDGDGLRVASAEYEQALARCGVLRGLRVRTGEAMNRPLAASPAFVELEGGASLVFADADSLSLALPAGPARVTLDLEEAPSLRADGGHAPTRIPGRAVEWRLEGAGAVQTVSGDAEPSVTLVTDGSPDARLLIRVVGDAGAAPSVAAAPSVGAAPHAELLAREEAAWRAWFARRPPVRADLASTADLAWWVLRANQVELAQHPRRAVVVASKLGYVAAWQWDSYFTAIGLRHGDPDLAWDQVALFLEHQAENGQLPDVVSDEGTVAAVRDLPPGEARPEEADAPDTPITKPPLAAWAAWAVHEKLGDPDRLAWASPRIAANHRWWSAVSDTNGDGLSEYLHRYSSGLDDSPLFDVHGVVEPPDLNSYLVVGDDRLARMASVLGRPSEAAAFARAADERAARLVERRWDPARARFRTMRGSDEVDILTPFALMPLLTGRLPSAVAEALTGTLTDPARLWTDLPVPTVAADEPTYDPDHMWRGPVWLGVNRLLVEGFGVSGRPELAGELAERTLDMVVRSGGIYEHWNAVTGRRASTATSMFSWSAAMFIDLAVGVSGG